ncbi:hypothetical protein RRF57_010435 [Xylaria bambusicola]|uniref:Nephrocystin 3-like N-terminal domain-containing protein n=1 Tax=Xylaria bambusicola TaxID=326684 RepID=A0AAN7USE1_9PEZI
MADISRQSLAVDFIDNHLPGIHPAFANLPAQFDPGSGRYVSVVQQEDMPAGVPRPAPGFRSRPPATPTPRELPPEELATMKFWDQIFTPAKERFTHEYTEPKLRENDKPKFCIRNRNTWVEIETALRDAQAVYDGKEPTSQLVKKNLRRFFAKINYVKPALNFVPSFEYSAPVLAVVDIILQLERFVNHISMKAAKVASEVPGRAAETLGHDKLRQNFGDIDTFLAIFPGDKVIEEASIQLIISVFKATEDAIGFYLDYMCELLDSSLRYSSFLNDSGATAEQSGGPARRLSYKRSSLGNIESRSSDLIKAAKTSQMILIHDLWTIVEEDSRKLLDGQQYVIETIEDLRSMTRNIDENAARSADKGEKAVEMLESVVSLLQDHILKMDKQIEEDARRAEERERQAIERDREKDARIQALTRLVASRTPSPQPQQLLLPPPSPVPAPVQWHSSQDELRKLVADAADIHSADLEYIRQRGPSLVPGSQREQAEGLIATSQFRDWIVAVNSRSLLVHGDMDVIEQGYVSGFSLVCTTLVQALKETDRFLPLVFFCGRHTTVEYTVGRAMLESFIAQLLRQHQFDTTGVGCEIVRDKLLAGDVKELCSLLGFLVRQIPKTTTLICLLDGIEYYERKDHQLSMGQVLRYLLNLTHSDHMSSVFKILITTPRRTSIVRNAPEFKVKDANNFLSMGSKTSLGYEPGSSRVARHFKESLGKHSSTKE